MTPPAGLSEAARAWLARGGDGFAPDPALDVAGLRAAREAYYGADAPRIVEQAGLTARTGSYGGIPCRIVEGAAALSDQAIFYVFGGGFLFGSPEQDMAIIASLARETGRPVIAPLYRLAPEHPYPAGLDDTTHALDAALGAYTQVALAGESAGAMLIMAAASRLLGHGPRRIPAVAILSPCTDMADLGDSGETNRDPVLDRDLVLGLPDRYAPGHDVTDPELSIVYGHYGAGFPPTLITTGTRDLFLSGCVRLERVMRESGGDVTLRVWEGMWHAFEFYGDALPEAQHSLAEIARFLTNHLDRTS